MLFPDLAISDDYQSSSSTKHTLSLTETLNSFYDYDMSPKTFQFCYSPECTGW